MADDTLTLTIVVLGIVMSVVTWFELRYLRKSSKVRRDRALKRGQELPDEAHNALVTTRAIVASLADRSHIRSEEVDSLMREAQQAYGRKNYRVTVELTKKAKDRLMALKAKQAAQGDLAKLDAAPTAASEEPTTKELLQKDFPANYVPSRFAISMAETSIESGAGAGRDVTLARSLLDSAKARFDAKDYAAALSVARLAEKSARGEAVAAPAPSTSSPATPAAQPAMPAPGAAKPPAGAVPLGSVCPSCGAPMKADDTFCRKCGTKVVATSCPTCGASLLPDDLFCRKCGTRLQR